MNDNVYVWDRFVRLFHWSLVGLFALSYLTGEENTTLHSYSGYAIVALVVARLVWGVVGSRHARFADFVRRPGEVLAYAREYVRGSPKRYLGHNPLGGAMTLGLLLSLALTTLSGMKLLAVEEGQGPFAASSTAILSPISAASARDGELASRERGEDIGHGSDDEGHEEGEEFWEDMHEVAVNTTLLLVALHVIGVLVSSRMHRESLVRAMLSGYKRPIEGEEGRLDARAG